MSFLHDIWNPWHGCVKCSEGCQNCYMYFLDRMRDQNGAEIYKTKSGFSYPLQKDRTGHYKIQSGEQIRVCMTSDFFLEEADPWRVEAWDIMRQRSDVVFFLLTTLDFVVSGAVFLERIGKAAFRFVDLGSVLVPHPVEKIHVAVLAALTALDAAVPWIPDVVQEAHLLSVPIIMVGQVGNKSIPCTAPPDVIG